MTGYRGRLSVVGVPGSRATGRQWWVLLEVGPLGYWGHHQDLRAALDQALLLAIEDPSTAPQQWTLH